MSYQLPTHSFINHVHEATTPKYMRSRLNLLRWTVTDRTATSRWDAPCDGKAGIHDEDIVAFLARLTEQITAQRPDAAGNDTIKDEHMESFRGLLARFKSIVEKRGLDYQGHGFSCRTVLASIHASLPEFWDELELIDHDADARHLEPAS